LRRVLRLVPEAPASSYHRQWRLVAIDGVTFSLANTKQVKKKCKKGGNQKGRAAFAKLQCAALVELVMHNPLAALVGTSGESEWKLALRLLDHLPEQCLLLADRLYGCGAFLVAAAERLKPRKGHFLVRVKESLKVRQIKAFSDGSRWVEIRALDPADYHYVVATMQVREIRATLQRRGRRPVRVRLWTSLSCTEASAQELVRLYASRWEQELYFRELKWHLGVNDLLRSQTPETAAQEVAAMIIGSSLIAHERAKLKPGEQLQHRVSFIKTWETLEPLWLTLLLGADILSEGQKQELCERFYALAARRVIAKKRSRSCPRAMRQPVQRWPRKRNQKSVQGPVRIAIRLRS
jgi:Transposase DDE domain